MNNNFNLQKYLIENKLTTNSKLLKEIRIEPDRDTGRPGGFVIEIEWGARGSIDSIKEYFYYGNFETYCYERGEQILEDLKEGYGEGWEDYVEELGIGEPYFNADMTACNIDSREDEGYIYILSSSLQEDVRTKLLDKETSDDEIGDIIDSLEIEYNQ